MRLLLRIGREAQKYKGLLIVAMICTLALTGINLIAPRILSRMTGMVSDGITRQQLPEVLYMALALLGLYGLRVVFRYLSNYKAHQAAWQLVEEMRVRAYNRIQSLSMDFFHDKQTGDLCSRVVNDSATFEMLYAHVIPEMVTNFVTLVGVTIILFTTNPVLAALTCIPIPFLLFSGWIFAKKIRPYFKNRMKTVGKLNARLVDNFTGMQEVQAFNQQANEARKVQGDCRQATNDMLQALKLTAIFHPSVELLTALGTVIVVGAGGYLAYRNAISVEATVSFLLYLSLFYTPITGLANLLEQAQEATAGAERVLEVLDRTSSIVDRPNARELTDCRGSIAFRGVNFGYQPDVPVIEDIDFEVPAGKMVALVGPTGVGKTTITQLLARFYDPIDGRVEVDGRDVRDYTVDSLRANISMVLQEPFLFNGTIAENIAYAKPDASMHQIVAAATVARIHEDIMAMPDGYQTQVGERGAKLSGGQKQRIAIARAVLKDAAILILDEATAAVDLQTEAEIQAALQAAIRGRTTVAIAHRLSTIRSADLILVLQEGRIVQRGTHEQLSAQPGLYRNLLQAQERSAMALQ